MTHMARNEGVINLSFNLLVGEYHIWISKYDQQYNVTVDCIDNHADVLRSKEWCPQLFRRSLYSRP